MAIWNNVSKKVTGAASKAGELSSIAKLKVLLHGEKQKLSEYYMAIGEAFCRAKSGGDTQAQCEELYQRVLATKAEINRLTEELIRLKKMKKCIACGGLIDKADDFCYRCGQSQNVKTESEPSSK